ncbi:MAG TPA: flagellar hook-basal body complex protein [Clostridiales bacterium]|nr:flagellar hook-basal body complex protein [Clostridiales bacterium]
MMRALWTAASGMTSQQTNVDVISNNLANINTTGYKKQTAEFKSLLYQTIQEQSTDNNGNPKPSGIQVGLGVRNSAISTQFTQGTFSETGNDTDFAISGKGFFMVQTPDGEVAYTRNGAFQFARGPEGMTLATAEGYPVLDTDGEPIVLDEAYNVTDITINEYGELYYTNRTNSTTPAPTEDGEEAAGEEANAEENQDEQNQTIPIGIRIGLAQFNNPNGLQKLSDSLLKSTDASGEARLESEDGTLKTSTIRSKYLEASNVQTVDEMVGLIVAQRAYEMNSKVITAADEMLKQANNLR